MVLIIAFLMFLLICFLLLLMPALWGREVHHAYAGARAVTCPETHRLAGVTIDARHAAASALRDAPEFRLIECTRWPARAQCGQKCLPEALRAEPYTRAEVAESKSSRRIYHLTVLLAAFAAWYIGMLWHSHFLFRNAWGTALGLTPAEVKELVMWYSPHVLSAAACLLFAYGVAWLQIWPKRKGFWEGILWAVLLWGALILTALPAANSLPHSLLIIEVTYTFIAAIAVGAIVGGLSGKLVLPPSESSLRQKTDVA